MPTALCAAIALLTIAFIAPAQAFTAGPEFTVNTTTTGRQGSASVAALTSSGFVVVWDTQKPGTLDDFAVRGQRFDDDGTPEGSEFAIGNLTQKGQSAPSVSGLSNGGFFVTWNYRGPGGRSQGIYGQAFDAVGAKVGREFRIDTPAAPSDYAKVAGLTYGGYVIAWNYGDDVWLQRFGANGGRIGNPAMVNTYTYSTQTLGSLTALNMGKFVVTWTSERQENPSAISDTGIYAQQYTRYGIRTGGEIHVNTQTALNQQNSYAAALADGGYVVAWRTQPYATFGASNIDAQRFDSAGAPVGAEFQVTPISGFIGAAAGLSDGTFVITWLTGNSMINPRDVVARHYSAAGVPMGGNFQINDANPNPHGSGGTSVAALPGGSFVVVWEANNGSTSNSTYESDIHARVYTP